MGNSCRMHIFGRKGRMKEGRGKSYAEGRRKTTKFYLLSLPVSSPLHSLWRVLRPQHGREKGHEYSEM